MMGKESIPNLEQAQLIKPTMQNDDELVRFWMTKLTHPAKGISKAPPSGHQPDLKRQASDYKQP
jgi:hypothetical protein